MKRRDFLRLSGTAVIAGLTRAVRAAPWIQRESDRILSVAHAEDWESGVLHDVRALRGDGSFAGRVTEVRVHEVRGANLDAIFNVGGADVPFQAAASGSVPMRFSMHSLEGTIALRRGGYVVVLHARTSPPNWRALQIREDRIEGNVAGGVILMAFN